MLMNLTRTIPWHQVPTMYQVLCVALGTLWGTGIVLELKMFRGNNQLPMIIRCHMWCFKRGRMSITENLEQIWSW